MRAKKDANLATAARGTLAAFLVFTVTFGLLHGCTIPRTLTSTGPCREKHITLAKWSGDAAKERGTIRVLLVHGMNNHPFGLDGNKPYLDGCATYAQLQKKLSDILSAGDRQRLRDRAAEAQFSYFIKRLASELHAGAENVPAADDFTVTRDSDNYTAIGLSFYAFIRETAIGSACAEVLHCQLGAGRRSAQRISVWQLVERQ